MDTSIKEDVIKKLEEYEIEIKKQFDHRNENIFMLDDLIIACKKNEVFINFQVGSNPSRAAKMVLILKEIKNLKEIYIGDDFLFDDKGNFINGDEAYKHYSDNVKDFIIAQFVNQQRQLYFLNNGKLHSC